MLDNIEAKNITGETPKERLHSMALELRRVIMETPSIGVLLATSTSSPPSDTYVMVRWVVDQLREMGLTGTNIVDAYQALEGFIFGITTYDISSLPDPLEARRQWCRGVDLPEFDEVARNVASIQEMNTRVFELGLRGLFEQFEKTIAQ